MALLALDSTPRKSVSQHKDRRAGLYHSFRKESDALERVELASAVLVVCAILTEDWDVLPKAAHPTSKDRLKALGGIFVAVFIALEILFSQFAKKHEGVVRDWHVKRVAELRQLSFWRTGP
jgi:hypothetical protein